jgi:multidrug resistance efflux pump
MKRLIIGILVVVLIGAAIYQYNVFATAGDTTDEVGETILASGTIEAETLVIAAETGGRVVGVHVQEGQPVQRGDLLVTLDAADLLAQQAELEAAIDTALANLANVAAGPPAEELAVAEAAVAQAIAGRDGAERVWQRAQAVADQPQALLLAIRAMESDLRQAESQVELAQAAQKRAAIQEEAASRNQSSHAALVGYEIAQKQHQAAGVGLKLTGAQVAALKTQLSHLWEQYNNPVTLQAGANQAEMAFHMAKAGLSLAEAKLAALQAQPPDQEMAVAQAQVDLAESGLALLEARLAQLTLTAPRDGIIKTQAIEPGEMAAPGATLLQLADLNPVTLRVFIPETQIGRVKLGQTAKVTVDSLAQPFEGTVSYIANKAEFTPKNVQTQQERVNLVFAVEISLDNPAHLLKPGMPADAEIVVGE